MRDGFVHLGDWPEGASTAPLDEDLDVLLGLVRRDERLDAFVVPRVRLGDLREAVVILRQD